MSKRDDTDVCLVLEGTYPYVSGGVSTWVDQIVNALPDLRFSIAYFGSEESLGLEEKYVVPENVRSVDTTFLFDELPKQDRLPSKRPVEQRSGVYNALEKLLESIDQPSEREHFLALIEQVLHSGRSMACANMWRDREAWELLQRAYSRDMSRESFLRFFWSVRFMIQPAWRAMRAAMDFPKAKVYHSLCTGYAGMAAAIAAHQNGGRYLLSEHGIYVRERMAEIQRAKWLPELPSRHPAVFEDLSAFRRLWLEFFKLLGRISYDGADEITSLFGRNADFQIAFGADPEKIEIVPNGIRPETFDALAETRKQLIKKHPKRKNIGFLGRIVRIKDVKTLLRSARLVVDEVPDAKFLLAGPKEEEPGYAAACEELTRSLGLTDNVEFLGPTQRDHLLLQIDVMLLTSISEGQPFVVIESFGAGVPVVSTDVGSCGELIDGKEGESPALGPAGLLTPVGDARAIARSVTALLKDRERATQMGEVGRKRVKAYYDEADMVSRYEELYLRELKN